MAVAVPMPMAVKSVREVAEAAIGHALAPHDGVSVQTARHLTKESRSTITALDITLDTAPMAPLPIKVKTTRRERFMLWSRTGSMLDCGASFRHAPCRGASKSRLAHCIVRSHSAAAGKMRCKRPAPSTEAAARRFARTGLCGGAG